MNALNKGRREVKKSLDATWMDNLEKLIAAEKVVADTKEAMLSPPTGAPF